MYKMVEQGFKAHTLLTDIPYDAVNQNDIMEDGDSTLNHFKKIRKLNKGNADVATFKLQEFLELVNNIVTDNFVIFCGKEQFSQIFKFFVDCGYTARALVWEKKNPSPMLGEYVYLSGVELAVYARKPKGTFNANCKNSVLRHNVGINEIHPTQKPLPLWYEILKDITNEKQIVIDPCMGSFTTAVACHRLVRRFIGFELDGEYFKRGYERLQRVQSQISMFDLPDEDKEGLC
jgi:DNA modification methylase